MGVLPRGGPDSSLQRYVPCAVMIQSSACEPREGKATPDSPLPWSGPGLALPSWLRTVQQIRLGAY